MPSYTYGCEEKHRQEETHGMLENPQIVCATCGKLMHRVPQVTAVIWGGLPPHLEHTRPISVQNMIDNSADNMAKFRDERNK